MTVILAILKATGTVILIVIAAILAILFLLLLVPFRYRLTEKGGSSETFRIEKTDPEGELTASWLLHFIHGNAKAVYREKALALEAVVRILGIPVIRLKKEMKIPPEKKPETEEGIEKTQEEKEETGTAGTSGTWKKLFFALKDDSAGEKTEKIKKHIGGILKNLLPRTGKQKIWFGTGDPFDTAACLGAAAFFYPLYRNTIEIIPDMAGSSLYSEGDISGKIFAGSVLYHAAVLYLDKDLRELLQTAKGDK